MKQAQSFSILIWANKARGSSLRAKLFARVTVDKKRVEISLKRNVDISRWDAGACKIKGNSPEARDLNKYLMDVKAELFNIYQQLATRNELITAEVIKNNFQGEPEEQHTLLNTIKIHNEDLSRRVGIDVAINTMRKYSTLESSFKQEKDRRVFGPT